MTFPMPHRCEFCNIIRKIDIVDILYEDDDVCVFPDAYPATNFHILVVPKRHIISVLHLKYTDKDLLAKMLDVAREQLAKKNFTEQDACLGYHWPPFRTVQHLHLHVIAPQSELNFLARLIFQKDSYWFVSPDYLDSMIS